MLLSKFISSYPYNLEIDFDKQWKYLIGRPFRFPKKMFVNLIYLILSKCSNFSNWSLWETMYLMSLSMFSHVQAFYLQELLTQDKKKSHSQSAFSLFHRVQAKKRGKVIVKTYVKLLNKVICIFVLSAANRRWVCVWLHGRLGDNIF